MDSIEKKRKVLMFAADMGGCAQYRLMLPAYSLMLQGKYDCRISMVINEEKYDWNPDVVVFARQHKPDVQKAILKWKEKGVRIVYDTDDDLFHVPKDNPAHHLIKPLRDEICETMRLADVITVSTIPLADTYRHLNDNIVVLPNNIALDYASNYKPNYSDTVRIGWAGTNTHVGDFHQAEEAIVKIARKYPNVKFIFMGYASPFIMQNMPKDKIEFHQPVKIEKYHETLGALSLDIGIAPLVDNIFNQGKSNLKILEYGVMGIPTIASPVYPYRNTIENEYDGLLVKQNKYNNWKKCLTRLIEDSEMRKRLGRNIFKKISDNYSVAKNHKLWEDVYFPEGT